MPTASASRSSLICAECISETGTGGGSARSGILPLRDEPGRSRSSCRNEVADDGRCPADEELATGGGARADEDGGRRIDDDDTCRDTCLYVAGFVFEVVAGFEGPSDRGQTTFTSTVAGYSSPTPTHPACARHSPRLANPILPISYLSGLCVPMPVSPQSMHPSSAQSFTLHRLDASINKHY